MSVTMLSLHEPRRGDRRLGPSYAIAGRTGAYAHDLRRLGLIYRPLSGAKSAGGPGTRVPGVFLVPKARLRCDLLLQAELRLLFARANGAPPREVEARQCELDRLRLAPARRAA